MDEPLRPCIVLIPTAYNPVKDGEPGLPVEVEVINEIIEFVHRQLGNFTIERTVEGYWEGQHDRSMQIKVSLPERRVNEFKMVAEHIGRRLGQKAMYIEIHPPVAQILLIKPEPTLFDDIEQETDHDLRAQG